MKDKTLYEVLEVSENASAEIIEKAYKVLAKKYHPDLQSPGDKQNAENKMKIQQVIERYKKIIDDYNERIAKVERGDKDIVMLEGSNIERTKELIKPMELMCRFIDNLLYGNYTLEQIQQYFSIWREKGSINILAPSDYTVSTSGRHANLAYKEENEGRQEKKDNGAR